MVPRPVPWATDPPQGRLASPSALLPSGVELLPPPTLYQAPPSTPEHHAGLLALLRGKHGPRGPCDACRGPDRPHSLGHAACTQPGKLGAAVRAACQGRGPTLPSPTDGSPQRGQSTEGHVAETGRGLSAPHGDARAGPRARTEGGRRAGRWACGGRRPRQSQRRAWRRRGLRLLCCVRADGGICGVRGPTLIPDPGKGEQCSERPLRGSNGWTGHRAGSLRGAEGSCSQKSGPRAPRRRPLPQAVQGTVSLTGAPSPPGQK